MKNLIYSLLLVVILSGCSKNYFNGSYVGELPEDSAISNIALDTTNYLVENYAPGHTTLNFFTPKKENENKEQDLFSISFENTLRQQGYTLADENTPDNAIDIYYILDVLDTKDDKNIAWYINLHISDGQYNMYISRAYNLNGEPQAGWSIRNDIKISSQDKIKEKIKPLGVNL